MTSDDLIQEEERSYTIAAMPTDQNYILSGKLDMDELRRIHWLTYVGDTDKIPADKWIEMADACARFAATGEMPSGPKIRIVK